MKPGNEHEGHENKVNKHMVNKGNDRKNRHRNT
jgi:hypothetical protein